MKADEIVPRPIKIEDQEGIAVVCKGRALFFRIRAEPQKTVVGLIS